MVFVYPTLLSFRGGFENREPPLLHLGNNVGYVFNLIAHDTRVIETGTGQRARDQEPVGKPVGRVPVQCPWTALPVLIDRLTVSTDDLKADPALERRVQFKACGEYDAINLVF